MNFDLELTGRRALVTGGTKGVGAAVVESLRNAGVIVVTTARSVPELAPEDREGLVHHRADAKLPGRGGKPAGRCIAHETPRLIMAEQWHGERSQTMRHGTSLAPAFTKLSRQPSRTGEPAI